MNLNFSFDLKKMEYTKEDVEKFALFALIGAAVAAGFWFALFAPGFHSVDRSRKKCAEMSFKIADAREKIQNAHKIKERYAATEARIAGLQAKMPRQTDPSWIIATVGEIEKKLNVKAQKIVPYTEKAQPGAQQDEENTLYADRFAQIDLKAGYHQIGQFINELENNVKYLQILNVSIEGDKDSPYRHRAEIKIEYPVLKQPLIE
jgi:Tfp pilus assembly protein PilO